jgi:hypothetical protein
VTSDSAGRLHELAGHLLFYYAQHSSFPPSLEALDAAVPGATVTVLPDPETGLPYRYFPPGLALPGGTARLFVMAPATARGSPPGVPCRWVVVMSVPEAPDLPAAQVLLVPESELKAALSAAR